MAAILVILTQAYLIFLCKFTFAWIIDMPRPHGYCKFRDNLRVEMFLKNAVSPFLSTFIVAKPFRPSHKHRYWFQLYASKISLFLRCSSRLTPIAHRTILVSAFDIHFSSLVDIGHASQL